MKDPAGRGADAMLVEKEGTFQIIWADADQVLLWNVLIENGSESDLLQIAENLELK